MPIILAPPVVGRVSGSPDVALSGTGTAQPTGIEAILEYNGVIFNRTDVIDKIRVMEIGGFDDADIRDAREINPGYHGETAFDSWYGGRTITLSGRIEAYSLEKLRDMQMALRQAFAELTDKSLIIRSHDASRDVMIRCRKSAPIAMRESQTDWRFFRDFQITLRAANPRFINYIENVENVALNGLTTATVELDNIGDFRSQPKFRIHGPVNNLTMSNTTNGEDIIFAGNIAGGGTYIDIDIEGRSIFDNNGTNRFDLLDMVSDWMELDPGLNNIDMTFSGTTANSSIAIFWRDSWM